MPRYTLALTIAATVACAGPIVASAQVPGGPPTTPPVVSPPPAPAPPPVGTPPPAPEPAPVPSLPLGAPLPADTHFMASDLRTLLKHYAAGWQFAISQGGKLAVSEADGTARTKADNGGVRLKMKPTMRYELASLTKNFTAVSTMKLLRLRGLTIESPITAVLPGSWKLSEGFKGLKFRHLLTHRSGINQAVTAFTKEQRDALGLANHYNGLREIAKLNVVPGSGYAYFNTNYALLRVLNARMWKAAGGKILGAKQQVLPVDAATNARYAMDFLQRRVLTPSGINGANCVAPSPATVGLNYYRSNPSQLDKGSIASWPSDQCAGNAGLRLSSIEVVRYLTHLRHGTIIDPLDLAQMDKLLLGWDKGSANGAFQHGGDITMSDGVQVHTCGITFPDGTEAALIVNSPRENSTYQCSLLTTAWKNAAR